MRTVIATDFTEPKPWWMKQQFSKTVPTLRCRINYGCQMKRQTKRQTGNSEDNDFRMLVYRNSQKSDNIVLQTPPRLHCYLPLERLSCGYRII